MQRGAMSYEHYRESKLGDALVDALREMAEADRISGELALKVLVEVASACLAPPPCASHPPGAACWAGKEKECTICTPAGGDGAQQRC